MLFFYPMWDHESQRIGKQKCTPLGYRLHGIAELFGFIGFMLLIAVGVFLMYRHGAGRFDRQLYWLLALPFGTGVAGTILYWYSWRLAGLKGFRYDPQSCEARWEEDGTVRTFRIEPLQPAAVATAAVPPGETLRILHAGKHTLTRLRYDNGVPEDTLLRTGKGTFLPGEFPDLPAAQTAAAGKLAKDPSALLYIVAGSRVLDTVMDREEQRRLHRQAERRHAVNSTLAVCGIAFCISIFALRLPSPLAHTVFAGCTTLIYLILLRLCGRRNYDALIIMVILLAMLAFLSTTLPK